MSEGDVGAVAELKAAILAHVERNPFAADTAKGIAEFWLPPQLQRFDAALVEAVLREMVAAGLLRAERLPDSAVIFRALTFRERQTRNEP